MKKNMTDDQKKAARAAYAKAYYEKLKAAKAAKADNKKKPAKKAEKPVMNAAKAEKNEKAVKAVKKAAKKANAAKTAVKKANVKKTAKKAIVPRVDVKKAAKKVALKKAVTKKEPEKFSMKPAQKFFDQIKKPLSNVRKLTKAYGKLISETLKANDAKSADRVSKLFSYAGFKFDKDNGVVTISINGKVKVPTAKKDEVVKANAVKPAKKRRGRKPKAEPAAEPAAEPMAEPVAEPAAEPAAEPVAEEAILADIQTEGIGEPDEAIDEEDEPEDTSRDRDLGEAGARDYGEALAETEEAMRENGDWES